MSTQIQTRQQAIRAKLRDLRAERAHAQTLAAAAREKFMSEGKGDTGGAAYGEALAARRRLEDINKEIEAAQEQDRALLDLLGDGTSRPGPGASRGGPVAGAWLSAIAAGPLAEAIDGLTTGDGLASRTDVGAPFVDRLTTRSALLASGPTILDVSTTEVVIPRLLGRVPAAPVVAELTPIPELAADLDEITVRPPKIARLITLSEEVWADARPALLAGHERELIRSVALGFDAIAWHGVEGEEDLPGILGTSGVGLVDGEGEIQNLDAIVEALAALRALGAEPSAIYMNPLTWGMLGVLKRSADSNEPLVSASLIADAPRLSLLGCPVYLSGELDEHTVVVAQASELLVVRRTAIEVRVARDFKFAEAGVGLRVVWRACVVAPQPEAVVVIENYGGEPLS